MEWREIILELNSMPPQKLNYVAERYSSWLNKVVQGCRGRDSKMRVLVQATTFLPHLWCTNAVDEN